MAPSVAFIMPNQTEVEMTAAYEQARYPKWWCGNTARMGLTICGAHIEPDEDPRDAEIARLRRLVAAAYDEGFWDGRRTTTSFSEAWSDSEALAALNPPAASCETPFHAP